MKDLYYKYKIILKIENNFYIINGKHKISK